MDFSPLTDITTHILTIADAFELYRQDFIVYRNQSPKTEEMHLLAMNLLIAFTGDIDISSLTFQQIRDWKAHLDKTRGQNTVRGYIIKLRVVLHFLKVRGYKVIDPEAVGVPKRAQIQVDFLSEMEVSHMITTSFKPTAGYCTVNRYRNRAIISMIYASGVRISELCRMNISDLKFEDRTFTVVGKGGKARLCFFDARSEEYIKAYLEKRGTDNSVALFLCDKTSGRITPNSIQMMFRFVRVKAGFTKPIHPHTLRHSYATNLLRNNTNLLYVRDFLGHQSIQTTEMYTHVVNEDLRKIYLEKHTV